MAYFYFLIVCHAKRFLRAASVFQLDGRYMPVAQSVSVSASNANSKIRTSNPAGNKKSFSIG